MNNWDYVLVFLLAIVLVLWGLFLYQFILVFVALLIPYSGWRFTILYFSLLAILLLISIVLSQRGRHPMTGAPS